MALLSAAMGLGHYATTAHFFVWASAAAVCICLLGERMHLERAAAHYRRSQGWASPPTLQPQLPLPCWPSSSSGLQQQQPP